MKSFKDFEQIYTELILAMNEQLKTNYSIIREELMPNGLVEKRKDFLIKLVNSKKGILQISTTEEEVDAIADAIKRITTSATLTDEEAFSVALFLLRYDDLID